MLYECHNLFIQYYKIAKEWFDSYKQVQGFIRIILNLQMRLIMETSTNQYYENLPVVNEIAVPIPDKYNELKYCNIILV